MASAYSSPGAGEQRRDEHRYDRRPRPRRARPASSAAPNCRRVAFTPTSTTQVVSRPSAAQAADDQHVERGRVAHHRDPIARRQRLRGQQQARRRTSRPACATRMTPDAWNSAATAASGTSTLVPRRPLTTSARARTSRRRSACGAPPAGAAAGELARVTEALQVQQDDVGRRVVLDQYCSRSLPDTSARLPAETNVDSPTSRRTASPSTATPSAPDWLKNPVRPRRGISGASEALSSMRRVVVGDAQAVRPDDAHPVRARLGHQRALGGEPGGPVVGALAEAAGDHDQPAHAAWPRTRSTTPPTTSAGTAITTRSTSPGMSSTPANAGRPSTSVASGLDRVDLAGEAGAQQVAQHRVADLAGIGTGADDRDRTGREQPPDRRGLGSVLTFARHRLGQRGLVDRRTPGARRRSRTGARPGSRRRRTPAPSARSRPAPRP